MSAIAGGAVTVRVEDLYLSLAALAKYSGLSIRTLRGYLVHPTHPLPHYRPAGKVLVKRSEFDAWMTSFRVASPARVDALVADILKGL